MNILRTLVFLGILFSYQTSLALSLNQPLVRSNFGEPLYVIIPLTLAPNEMGRSVIIQQMTPKEDDPLGTSRFVPRLDLEFELVVDDNLNHQIIVKTRKPVNELIIELSLMVQAGPNRIIRQYDILLDPVGMPATRKVAPRKTPAAPAPRAATTPAPRMVASEAGTYVVQSGDSLSKIAQKFKGEIGLDSTSSAMVAIYEANPNAFVRGDADKIKLGYTIDIPNLDALEPMTWNQAKQILYRDKQLVDETRVVSRPAPVAAPTAPAPRATQPEPISEPVEETPDYKLKLLTSEEEAKYPAPDRSEPEKLVYQSPESLYQESAENVALKNKLRSQVNEMETQLTTLRENIKKLEETLANTETEMNTLMSSVDLDQADQYLSAEAEPVQPAPETDIDLLRLLLEVLTLGAAVGFIFYLVSLRKRQTAERLFR
jgi:pilus assembly protein FimV